jgi:hypothetical protein
MRIQRRNSGLGAGGHEGVQAGEEVGVRHLSGLAQAIQAFLQAGVGDGFQQVVGGGLFEGGHGVFVVGGDEYHAAAMGCGGGGFQAGEAGHADVQEGDVRGQIRQGGLGGEAVLDHGGDGELRPQALQAPRQVVGQQGLVLGDQGAHGSSSRTCTPPPAWPEMLTRPASP